MTEARDDTVGAWMTPCPVTVAFDASLAEAAELMGEHAVRHLPVVRDGHAVGVLSDRDIAAVESLPIQGDREVRVAEAMTPVPYAVPASMALSRVARMMARQHYGCAVVTGADDDRVLGVFTVTDALRALAEVAVGRR
ncbi:MAG: CBS domain-containing protein [Myxococcales bacterium]|jgi:CBS domain-containing protein